MSEVLQVESHEPVTDGGSASAAGPAVANYKVLPYDNKGGEDELFSFRDALSRPEEAANPEEQQEQKQPRKAPMQALGTVAIAVLALAAALLFVYGTPKLVKTKAPALYLDMGNRRLEAVGLAGRLIARWEGSAAFQLYIDPLDEDQVARFQAVAQNPPYPLSFMLLLKDASGVVTCQKEIVLPAAPVQTAPGDASQALMPRVTTGGDTVQNMAGSDGQIAEITVSGALPCSQSAYQHLAGWEFSSNFPAVDEQANLLKQETAAERGRKGNSARAGGSGLSPRIQRLAAPIDGDDVIVGDNPSRDTVDTRGGRVFLLGMNGLRNYSAEWQTFPAPIHFRCEKSGFCVLTRVSSNSTLQARLMR